jgi:transcriptional regulator with XRE-family HTH domain
MHPKERQIIRLLKAGKTQLYIERALKVSHVAVKTICNKIGWDISWRKPSEKKIKVLDLYHKGYNCCEIAKKMKCTRQYISLILIESGVSLTAERYQRKLDAKKKKEEKQFLKRRLKEEKKAYLNRLRKLRASSKLRYKQKKIEKAKAKMLILKRAIENIASSHNIDVTTLFNELGASYNFSVYKRKCKSEIY